MYSSFTLFIALTSAIVLPLSTLPASAKPAKKFSLSQSAAREKSQLRAQVLSDQAVDLMEQGKHAEAEKLLRRAVRIAPRSAEIHLNLGSVLWLQDKTAEAEKVLRAGLKLSDNSFAKALLHHNLADILLNTRRYEAAAQEYRAALALDKEDEDSRLGLFKSLTARGKELSKQERWREAEPVWREAYYLKPGNLELEFQFASALLGQKKYSAAMPHLKNVAAIQPYRGIYVMALASAMAEQKQEAEAEVLLRSLISRKWNEVSVRRKLASILTTAGKHQKAEVELRAIITLAPQDAATYVQLAQCLLRQNRRDEAGAAAKKARELGRKADKALDAVEKQLAARPTTLPATRPVSVANDKATIDVGNTLLPTP